MKHDLFMILLTKILTVTIDNGARAVFIPKMSLELLQVWRVARDLYFESWNPQSR